VPDQRGEQRRLASAGRAGDADDVTVRLASELARREGARERGRAFAVVGMRALEQVEDGGRCREIARAQARGEISARAFVRRASLM